MPRPRPPRRSRLRGERARAPETALYAPIKAFLEAQGYSVKGEVLGCDLMAVRGDEPPVIVELKTAVNLELLLQGVDRLALAEHVYVAVPAAAQRSPLQDRRFHKMLRRIGLGLLVVHGAPGAAGTVEAVLDPVPYRPRRDGRRRARMLAEFARRAGDPNAGGSSGRIKLVTAYRQACLRIAHLLAERGPAAPARLARDADAPKAARMLQQDVYGWFERISRGVYALSPAGAAALATFAGRFTPPGPPQVG